MKIEFKNKYNSNQNFAEMESIDYHVSFTKPTGWHSFGEYRYYKIIFNDKTSLIVSSVLINNIEKNFAGLFLIEAKVHNWFLALIMKLILLLSGAGL